MAMPKLKNKSLKSLGGLKSPFKGAIHHVEIHPAKNSDGSRAFLSKIHRERPPAQQAAMDAGGNFTPPPEPEETQHPNYPDAVNHVAKAYGVPPPAMEGDEEEQEPDENEGDE